MKKRRELDALVTNGKLPRRKSKSGHELLRSNDSDSSEVEEFSVPIGKTTGKKWIGICPCSSCVALLVFIVMTSCLIACGGLIWMHFELKRDLDNLRERLLTVENRNQGAPEEFQKYHSQIQDLNRTLHDIRSGDKGLDKITKNLTNLVKQLNTLNKVTDELKNGLKTAPYLKNLPNEFDTLKSTVAKMGSDILSAKEKVNSLEEFKKGVTGELADLKKKVADMENKTQASVVTNGGREHGSTPVDGESSNFVNVGQKLQILAQDIDKLNKSLVSQLEALNSSLHTHETRLSLLENYTSHLQIAATESSTSKTKSEDVEKHPVEGEGKTNHLSESDMSSLASLLEKVDNITAMVATLGQSYSKLQKDIASVNKSHSMLTLPSELEGLDKFHADTLSNFEYLNSTVLALTERVDHLHLVFTKNRNEINNATAHIDRILKLVGHGFPKHNQDTESMPTVTPTSTLSSTKKTTEAVTLPPPIKMKLVKNMDDLRKGFNRWDRMGMGQIDPEDLPDFMPDAPTVDQLKPFDADNNGRYSLEELAVALGFKAPKQS